MLERNVLQCGLDGERVVRLVDSLVNTVHRRKQSSNSRPFRRQMRDRFGYGEFANVVAVLESPTAADPEPGVALIGCRLAGVQLEFWLTPTVEKVVSVDDSWAPTRRKRFVWDGVVICSHTPRVFTHG